MSYLIALLSGLIFGVGLILSGMADPSKVLGFLDLAGAWDPSLAFVMAGAIAVGVAAFALARRQPQAWDGGAINLPKSTLIDKRLVLGGLAFGAGWGLAGYCPGPAITALGTGAPKAVVFVVAMLVGMALYEFMDRKAQHALDVGAAPARR